MHFWCGAVAYEGALGLIYQTVVFAFLLGLCALFGAHTHKTMVLKTGTVTFAASAYSSGFQPFLGHDPQYKNS